MKASDLVSIWEAPDNSRLTPKQFSLRLPVHVAAQLSALCEMYPNKTRTEIIGDLLTAALDQLQSSFPTVKGRFVDEFYDHESSEGVKFFEDKGPTNKFRELSNKHFESLEKELGNESPAPLFSSENVVVEEREK
ncbi:hypothetical protein D8Y20_13350 [Mariprofundus sp. EBB-1]|uniref:hypothetical protein n=1 Tax=Mariprofundus sp. EBB-1 TaxID=2650971 RepID=UPI000EF1C06C|nr:hypothetical protein [Mariprofundus sp. EBB-1]RLL49116.1 hypothetical protein D8Y20_13350 [Mariprofundus sp. EBB-1]